MEMNSAKGFLSSPSKARIKSKYKIWRLFKLCTESTDGLTLPGCIIQQLQLKLQHEIQKGSNQDANYKYLNCVPDCINGMCNNGVCIFITGYTGLVVPR